MGKNITNLILRLEALGTIGLLCLLFVLPTLLWGRENVGGKRSSSAPLRTSADLCLPATSSAVLDVNNVRTLLLNGGDMWWDLTSNPRYEIPKVDDPSKAKHSLFAGSLWIGGLDESSQLRIAAQTYRQSGNDFWPGPLRLGSGDTEKDICDKWNKHYKITRAEIDEHRAGVRTSAAIETWPAVNNDPGFERFLAPFQDVNGDFDYKPEDGDYPSIIGDQAIWWVVNDRGNIHTSTNGLAIGVEIQMMAFGFNTANAINNMTFYKQKVINRSTLTLSRTYIGQWVDADLGYAFDDYVGCDTIRGLGICYNGDPVDNLPQGYGEKPPAVGVDFFQGPLADPDSLDNDGDNIIDNERIGMARFVYYNNDFSRIGNPEQKEHFYNYLIGRWKDGQPVIDDRKGNGNGYPDPSESILPTNYMFPDYPGSRCSFVKYTSANRWDEKSVNNVPQDRRFIQSAGPFTLKPGAVNEIIVGVVWARDQNNIYDSEQLGSYCALLQADDIAQALFDANFQLLDGPDAPTLEIQELDRELVLSWSYKKPTSNNYYENYAQKDPILEAIPGADAEFTFQGYLVYQLSDDRVSTDQLNDPSKARLVAQCDIRDGISTIVNREEIAVAGLPQPIIQDRIMVYGEDKGIFRSVRVVEDKFAEGTDTRLVNYRPYYYTVVAYAYNDTSSDGRKFIIGRNFESPERRRVQAMPRKVEFEAVGTVLNAGYGNSPLVTRAQGQGHGNKFLNLTEAMNNQILNPPYFVGRPIYLSGFTPISVKVVNPKNVLPKKYRLEITKDLYLGYEKPDPNKRDADTTFRFADWVLFDVSNNRKDTVYKSIYVRRGRNGPFRPAPMDGEERIIEEVQGAGGGASRINHGFSIAINNVPTPGDTSSPSAMGFIGAQRIFKDPIKNWLSGLRDFDNVPIWNWIRSGPDCAFPKNNCNDINKDDRDMGSEFRLQKRARIYDPHQVYENVLGGTWAPYVLAAHYNLNKDIIGPKLYIWTGSNQFNPVQEMHPDSLVTLDKLPSVDIVITSDPSKWSRCVVVETSPSKALGSGAPILTAKWRKSLSLAEVQSGNPVMRQPDSETEEYGMSYFPGYAINVETGERLNIFFGESTWHRADNGDDMLFNPTNRLAVAEDAKVVGGRHYLYVSNTRYDECKAIARVLRVPPDSRVPDAGGHPCQFTKPDGVEVNIASAYQSIAWTSIPMVELGRDQFLYKSYANIPSDVKISLRVQKPYTRGAAFEFDMTPFAVQTNQMEVAKSAINLINIVPNPFYGRSGMGRGSYERTQIDSRVKITNLPQKCNVRIFTLNGNLVRIYRKESDAPDIEWDLKNEYGVPIASGFYIIHIDAGDLGEKVLKFFAVMPELDLNAY
jgi:hypothetical protein